ncbi:MAG: gliding motility-associated C-terminal domain-containing protein [Bacteroidetes bacterium]|nr:gliding motility-associated C-terminal domain-containing protein [Bacteroidota bacterium]
MKNKFVVLLVTLCPFSALAQTADNCGNYTTTGTSSSPYLPGSNTTCNNSVPGTVNTNGAWCGFGCGGVLISSVVGPPVTCLSLAYTAVNTDDFATLTTDTGGALTITGVNVGVSGNVIGPYQCGTDVTGYGDVMVTVCSTIPFSSLTLTNTGCSSGWVINCATPVTCTITNLTANIGACVPGPSTYSTTGQVSFTNAPASGQLIVEDCNGNQQVFNAPFTSPANYTISNQNADGAACDITAYFTADPACTQTVTYTAPICGCNMSTFNANIGLCNQTTNEYMVDGDLTFVTPPGGGQLIVEVDNGTTIYDTIINPPFTSPQTWSISGIPSDGAGSTVTAYFTADPTCSSTIAYTAPTACVCLAEIGTFTATITGSSANNYVLCYGDQIDINTNNDWIGPGEQFTPPGPVYDEGVSWLMYSCPPTVALTPDPFNTVPSDPCFLGLVSDFNLSDINDLSMINSYPPGTFTDNIIYYVPITMYSMVSGTYSYVNGTIPCYELGPPYAVQYLPQFSSSIVEDCNNGTSTVTVSGGLPAIDGSNFTASNLLPVTASFANTTTPNNGTFVINGLNGGENYSFTVTDGNGCPSTITGGPFPPLQDPSFTYPSITYCETEAPSSPTITGVAGGTFTATPAGLTLNAASGQITPATSTPATYTVTYTTPGPCPDNTTFTLTIAPTPTVNPVADQTVCEGSSFTAIGFTGSAGATFDWTNTNTTIGLGASGTGSIAAFNGTGTVIGGPAISGTITVTPTVGTCVGATTSFTLTVNSLPDATISGTTAICASDPLPDITFNLTAGTPNWDLTYNFNGNPVTFTTGSTPYILSGAAAGSYDLVSVTDANNCTNAVTGNATISINPTPVMNPLVDQEICEGSNLSVQGFASNVAGSSFDWVNVTGTDVGFGLSGTGNIPIFLAVNGTGTDIPVTVSVTPTSPQNCVGNPATFIITIHPNPVVSFVGDSLVGCEPHTVNFTNTSSIPGQNCVWSFGTGLGATGCGTVTTVFAAGTYSVSLDVTTADGCFGSATVTNYIQVYEQAEAAFSYSPQVIDIDDTEVEFLNQSDNADGFAWDFGDTTATVYQVNPSHTYPIAPNQYLATLIATNSGMCPDTAQQLITIQDVIIFYVPNVFTPDHDEFNEGFQPVFTSGFDPFDYHLIIFNRWGEIVFESYNAAIGWDGTYSDQGLVEDGVYVWQIEFKENMSDKRHTHRGHVTVLK